MTIPSEILARQMHLPRAQTHDVISERGSPRADGRRRGAAGRPLGGTRARRRGTADRPGPLAVRTQAVRRPAVRPAAGRAGTPGRRPERARHVWLRRRASARSTSAPTAWRRFAGSASSRGTPSGSGRSGRATWGSCSGRSRPMRATIWPRSRSRSAPRSFTARPTPAAACRSRPPPRGWCSWPSRSDGSRRWRWLARCGGCPALLDDVPLAELDERATGAEVDWFREAMQHSARDDAYWVARDFAAGVAKVTAPVQLIGGWYDIFLPWMLEDFGALRDAGHEPQLLIGPWTHTDPGLVAAGTRDGIAWLRAHLLGDDRLVRTSNVRVFVTGESVDGRWRDLESWPPPGTVAAAAVAGSGRAAQRRGARGRRRRRRPLSLRPGRSDAVGRRPGAAVARAGRRQPRARGARRRADLHDRRRCRTHWRRSVRSTSSCSSARARRTSTCSRACATSMPPAPRWNVCDALDRVAPGRFEQLADGAWRVAFELWPIAHRFAAGHRIRLQVSSGAHPRYARNPGTGEDPNVATAAGRRRARGAPRCGAPVSA